MAKIAKIAAIFGRKITKNDFFKKKGLNRTETPKIHFLSKIQLSITVFEKVVAFFVHFSKTRFSKKNQNLARFWSKTRNNWPIFQHFWIFGAYSIINNQTLLFDQALGDLKHLFADFLYILDQK